MYLLNKINGLSESFTANHLNRNYNGIMFINPRIQYVMENVNKRDGGVNLINRRLIWIELQGKS